MKRVYHSLEELMSSCCNSTLKSCVSSVLTGKLVPWSFVSASMNGDFSGSEFSSPIEGTDLEHHLSCKIGPRKEHWYYSICVPGVIPAMPRVNF